MIDSLLLVFVLWARLALGELRVSRRLAWVPFSWELGRLV